MVQTPTITPGVILPHWCRAARRGADKRRKGIADRNGAGARAAGSATTLVADEVKHPIRLNPPEQVESRLTGRMPPTSYSPLE